MKIKTGIGIDVHRLEAGREFWLGGIKIGHEKGCVAHSDGDVLIHAICDALLGATGLGDIGQHFPDTCPAYKGIDSKLLLQKTKALIDHRGYAISNIDSVVCLQRPKIRPFIDDMRHCLKSWNWMSTIFRSKRQLPNNWASKAAKKGCRPMLRCWYTNFERK